VQGHVIFTRRHPGIGPSVWTTDGTLAGTRLVADVDPGVSETEPYNYVALGNLVFFNGYAPQTGSELYGLDIAQPNATDEAAIATSGSGTPIAVLANDGGILAPLDPSSVQITSAPTLGTTSIDSATGRITYTPNAGAGGSDQFSYTVADTRGVASAPATVYVAIAQPAGPAPGSAPAPPPPTPGSGGHSGGGALDPATLAALMLLAAWIGTRRHRRRARDGG
jgi:ELWxxDGT repeat protein